MTSKDNKNMLLPEGVKVTPMLKQWLEIKKKAKDAIVLFRMGDFYEIFAKDAKKVSSILGLTLTSRNKKKGKLSISMVGFPYYTLSSYILKLIENGFKIAICEQEKEQKNSKGLIDRSISRIITPGTLMGEGIEHSVDNNFLVSVYYCNNIFSISALDVSTGDFITTKSNSRDRIIEEIIKISPSEMIVFEGNLEKSFIEEFYKRNVYNKEVYIEKIKDKSFDDKILMNFNFLDPVFKKKEWLGSKVSIELILNYINKMQKNLSYYIQLPKMYSIEDYLLIDEVTRRHLSIMPTKDSINKKSFLFSIFNFCKTSIGRRLLIKYLLAPSTSIVEINMRLLIVLFFFNNSDLRYKLLQKLKEVYDINRLVSKAAHKIITPKELFQVKHSLLILPDIILILEKISNKNVKKRFNKINKHSKLKQKLVNALVELPSLNKDNKIFKKGYNKSLDFYMQQKERCEQNILKLEQSEKLKTGIKKLKIKFTRTFGYCIEISRTYLNRVPKYYIRKQTVSSGERYTFIKLSDFEAKLALLQEKILKKETELFHMLKEEISKESLSLLKTAHKKQLYYACNFKEGKKTYFT